MLSLSASFLSLSKLFSSEWYLEHNLLRNLSEFDQITKNDTLTVQIYGVSVSLPGYSTVLSIHGVVPNYKTFSVVLLNEFGNSSHSFSLRETKGNIILQHYKKVYQIILTKFRTKLSITNQSKNVRRSIQIQPKSYLFFRSLNKISSLKKH